jgi:hypothetical protein
MILFCSWYIYLLQNTCITIPNNLARFYQKEPLQGGGRGLGGQNYTIFLFSKSKQINALNKSLKIKLKKKWVFPFLILIGLSGRTCGFVQI